MGHKVFLGFPGNAMGFGTALALFRPTDGRHTITVANSAGSWDNFNSLWASALNSYEAGFCDSTAQIHGDIEPVFAADKDYWLDVLLGIMDDTGAALVSVAVPIKDSRGVLSCGIGDPDDPWQPFRRLTMRELHRLPDTFDAADIAEVHGHARDYYAGHPLLHNNGLFVADLRNPVFHRTDSGGNLLSYFNFPKRVGRKNGKWSVSGESEDWFMSRALAVPGVKTLITKKIRLVHKDGGTSYPNTGEWGTMTHDEATVAKWQTREACERIRQAEINASMQCDYYVGAAPFHGPSGFHQVPGEVCA